MKLELKELGTVKDRFDRVTQISALVSDGKVVAFIHSQDESRRYSDGRDAEEHVIQAISIRKDGPRRWDTEDVRSVSCPTRSSVTLDFDPTLEQAWEKAKASYDWENGYNFLMYGEKGETVPADATPAFREGMKDAQHKFPRVVRKDKLCGNPRGNW